MKAVASLFLIFLASNGAQKLEFSPEFSERIANARSECTKTENVDPKYLAQLDSAANFPTMEQLKCHTLCMINKFKLLDGDLRFQVDQVGDFVSNAVLQARFMEVFERCLPEDRKIKACEDAYDLHKCVIKNFLKS